MGKRLYKNAIVQTFYLDAELDRWLKQVGKDGSTSKSGYINRLIREDYERIKKEREELKLLVVKPAKKSNE